MKKTDKLEKKDDKLTSTEDMLNETELIWKKPWNCYSCQA